MTGHIFIEGEIGTQVTAKTVRADIDTYQNAEEWIIHVNSPGGDVYEGYQIGSILRNLGKPTTALIGSMCASIATYDALCCDTVVMSPHGDFMIHLPTATINGTAEDLRKGAMQLDRIKSELISRYAPKVSKKGVTRDQLSAMMEQETSMSPGEALAMGFVDEVREKLKAVAKWDLQKINNMDENQKGIFEAIGSKLDAIMAKLSPKNMVEVTLADGTVAMSSAATAEELVGSVLTDEAGAVIPDGVVETADGLVVTIAGGKVASVEPKTEEAPEEDANKLKEENAALKQQLAEANAAIAASKQTAEASTQQLEVIKNEVSELKKTFKALKDTTVGDKEVPGDAHDKTTEKEVDPLLEAMARTMGQAYITSRPKF